MDWSNITIDISETLIIEAIKASLVYCAKGTSWIIPVIIVFPALYFFSYYNDAYSDISEPLGQNSYAAAQTIFYLVGGVLLHVVTCIFYLQARGLGAYLAYVVFATAVIFSINHLGQLVSLTFVPYVFFGWVTTVAAAILFLAFHYLLKSLARNIAAR